jgi:GH25 family lysozyme M1 (1,4-beta-N-acetylmuramidase)
MTDNVNVDNFAGLREHRVAHYTYSTIRRIVQFITGSVQPDTVQLGADGSYWQSQINFLTAKAAGINDWHLRALYGLSVDLRFAQHWADSDGIVPRGAYLYYLDELSPLTQADKLYQVLTETGDVGELTVALDVETYNNPTLTASKIRQCAERLTTLFGRLPFVYTNYYVWKDAVPGDKAWAVEYPLWIAAYPFTDWKPEYLQTVLNYPPMIPAPWTSWEKWQWSAYAPAAQYGVSGNYLDLNYTQTPAVPPPDEKSLEERVAALEASVAQMTTLNPTHRVNAAVTVYHGPESVDYYCGLSDGSLVEMTQTPHKNGRARCLVYNPNIGKLYGWIVLYRLERL